jgi:threonine/homoserine/homoserine lactone efflux protein
MQKSVLNYVCAGWPVTPRLFQHDYEEISASLQYRQSSSNSGLNPDFCISFLINTVISTFVQLPHPHLLMLLPFMIMMMMMMVVVVVVVVVV